MDNENKIKEVTVAARGEGKFAQQVTIGNHTLIVDEPRSVGGDDAGPSPYDLILAALGSCTSITLSLYAKLKKIPLEKVNVKLTHSKIHAQDCAECDKKTVKIDHIDRKIEVEGNLTNEQLQALLAVANKCPVHQTLTSKIEVETSLDKKK